MLLFINNMDSGNSTVLEFDPRTEERFWSYGGSEEQPLYSKYLGGAERLWNGNTLITESDGGRAFEVTPEHEIIWEFISPHRVESKVARLFDLKRIDAKIIDAWLQ